MSKKNDRITAVTIRGYKSIHDQQRIELRPLTILAGANSSGKSSIMQPLLLLKQTLETPFDPGALLLHGPNVRLTSTDQIMSRISRRKEGRSFSIGLEKGRIKLEVTFKKASGRGVDVESMKYGEDSKTVTLKPNMQVKNINEIFPQNILPKHFSLIQKNIQENLGDRGRWVVERERCFINISLKALKAGEGVVSFGFAPFPQSWRFESHIEELIHVPALRGNPERIYQKSAIGPRFPGTFENYVASIIAEWKASKTKKLAELGRALEHLGLTWKVDAIPVDDTHVELRVGRLMHSKRGGAYDLVNIADVGFGVSQTLPVIVSLLAAKPGQIVYMEQPEIHLHPKAQMQMAEVLANTAKRGVIVIAETHSEKIVRCIQTLVAKNHISSKDVKLHWFTRDPVKGMTQVSSANLDKKGAFGDWPEDFDEVSLEAEQEYLDLCSSSSSARQVLMRDLQRADGTNQYCRTSDRA